jgi:hypothetical protein
VDKLIVDAVGPGDRSDEEVEDVEDLLSPFLADFVGGERLVEGRQQERN